MKNCIILLLLFSFASCSSFDRMKYRHLDKVPATPQDYHRTEKPVTAKAENSVSFVIVQDSGITTVAEETIQPVSETTFDPASESAVLRNNICEFPGTHQPAVGNHQLKRDWSLAIGTLLIISGLAMLALCIFYFPAAGISFLWMIAFELASLYAAWRMIGTGVMYFITRFRNKRNFSER